MSKSIIALIAAMDPRQVIGNGDALPWHLPEDLKRFRRLTMGKPVIMGRRTHESIGRPLPGRRNIVVSRRGSATEGIEVVASLGEAIGRAGAVPEIMVCGGAAIYAAALPLADRLYITRLEQCFEGDVFFPAVDWDEWREVERVVVGGEAVRHQHTNILYERCREP